VISALKTPSCVYLNVTINKLNHINIHTKKFPAVHVSITLVFLSRR